MTRLCFNHHDAPATIELTGRPMCASCARTLGLKVPALPVFRNDHAEECTCMRCVVTRTTAPSAEELADHARAGLPLMRPRS